MRDHSSRWEGELRPAHSLRERAVQCWRAERPCRQCALAESQAAELLRRDSSRCPAHHSSRCGSGVVKEPCSMRRVTPPVARRGPGERWQIAPPVAEGVRRLGAGDRSSRWGAMDGSEAAIGWLGLLLPLARSMQDDRALHPGERDHGGLRPAKRGGADVADRHQITPPVGAPLPTRSRPATRTARKDLPCSITPPVGQNEPTGLQRACAAGRPVTPSVTSADRPHCDRRDHSSR